MPRDAAHGVDGVVIVDPLERRVHWFGLAGQNYDPVAQSRLSSSASPSSTGRSIGRSAAAS